MSKDTKEIIIRRSELEDLNKIVARFPEIDTFKLIESSTSGIGSVLSVQIETTVKYIKGKFIVEVSGPENW
jgi:hypothetical protein